MFDGWDRASWAAITAEAAIPWALKRAMEYMRAELVNRITLSDLVAASGVSERTLIRQFQIFLGVTPIAQLERLRLAAVREQLLRAPEGRSVADIAAEFGLTHFGRFAASYRRRFGELPSATLRRARAAEAALQARTHVSSRPGYRKPDILLWPLSAETRE